MSAACPVFGFDVVFRLHDWVGEAAVDSLWDAFIAEAVERHGLVAGGGLGQTWRHTVMRESGQATEADRVAISNWAAARDEISSYEIGPLVDLSSAA